MNREEKHDGYTVSSQASSQAPLQKQHPVVFYDGGCSLCRKEISHYRRLDRSGRIQWVDIIQSGDELEKHNIKFDKAMQELHAIDINGNVQIGVPAFLVIWSELKPYIWLSKLISALRLTGLLNRVYKSFAKWRISRRQCELP